MLPASGFFLSLEGIDGAGKSSHLGWLKEYLQGTGREVLLTREPGGTPLGEKLRATLLSEAMLPLSEALLFFAARHEHWQQRIAPALARGAVVLSDRFTDASFAYQAGGRGLDWRWLETLEAWCAPVRPDLTFWFDLPAEEAARRLNTERAADRFEAEPRQFFEHVSAAYRRRAEAEPDRILRIDAAEPFEIVRAQILAALQSRLHSARRAQ